MTPKLAKPERCPRCDSTLIAEWYDGDWICAYCGSVMYCTPPPEGMTEPSVDRPSGKGAKHE